MSDDIHALSGAYAVDAVDDVERARFERHLADCAACQDEVASLSEAANAMATIIEMAPPAGLRERVMREIKTVRPLAPLGDQPHDVGDDVATPGDLTTTLRPRPEDQHGYAAGPAGADGRSEVGRVEQEGSADRPDEESSGGLRAVGGTAERRFGLRRGRDRVLAGAAAVLIAVGGFSVWRAVDQPTIAEQVVAAADATQVRTTLPGGGSAVVWRSASLGRAVIQTTDLSAPPSGRVYQLWLQDAAGGLRSAGLLGPGADQTVALEGDARAAKGVGISVEPVGGSVQPTTEPLALLVLT